MKVRLQVACTEPERCAVPAEAMFDKWARATVDMDGEVVVRAVDADEMRTLNKRYRKIDKPTNVLAFPYEATPLNEVDDEADYESNYLGDIVITAPLVVEEADERGDPVGERWTLLFVHALLHLLGYDHELDADAERMQKRESEILASLGLPSPYDEGVVGEGAGKGAEEAAR